MLNSKEKNIPLIEKVNEIYTTFDLLSKNKQLNKCDDNIQSFNEAYKIKEYEQYNFKDKQKNFNIELRTVQIDMDNNFSLGSSYLNIILIKDNTDKELFSIETLSPNMFNNEKYVGFSDERIRVKINDKIIDSSEQINLILNSLPLDEILNKINEKSNQIEFNRAKSVSDYKELKQKELFSSLLDRIKGNKDNVSKTLKEIKKDIDVSFDISSETKGLFVEYNGDITLPFENPFILLNLYNLEMKQDEFNIELITAEKRNFIDNKRMSFLNLIIIKDKDNKELFKIESFGDDNPMYHCNLNNPNTIRVKINDTIIENEEKSNLLLSYFPVGKILKNLTDKSKAMEIEAFSKAKSIEEAEQANKMDLVSGILNKINKIREFGNTSNILRNKVTWK